MIPSAGSHIVIAENALVARIAADTAEILMPVEDGSMRAAEVIAGWFDPELRHVPLLPLCTVRPTSGGQVKRDDGQRSRPHIYEVGIGVHCPTVADHQYAYAFLEHVWRCLTEEPYLDGGRYLIDWDGSGLSWREVTEVPQSWNNYLIAMSVPVILPAYSQTRNENGETIRWEDEYKD